MITDLLLLLDDCLAVLVEDLRALGRQALYFWVVGLRVSWEHVEVVPVLHCSLLEIAGLASVHGSVALV